MESKHTPGPWKLPTHVCGSDIGITADDRLVAMVANDEDRPMNDAEQLANARLVARGRHRVGGHRGPRGWKPRAPWSVETMTTRFKKSRADYPAGVLSVYDNGGRTIDRYTVVYSPFTVEGRDYFPTLHMSASPTHPQGYGIHDEYERRPTRLPGDRVIPFDALPADCRRCVESDLRK